jgi:hypothetical protein
MGIPASLLHSPISVHRLVWPSLPLEFLDRRCDTAPDSSALVVALACENRSPGSCLKGGIVAVSVDDEFGGAVDVEVVGHTSIGSSSV